MCHVWLSSSYKISCLGKSAYLSGNDTKLWMQSAETRCNGAIEEPWHVVALKATELLPWMSLLSLLAKLPGIFLVILSLGHNTKTHGSKYMYLQTGPTWGYQFQWDGYGWIPHLDVIQILLHLRWTASRTRITPGQYCAIQKHHCHCLSEQDTQQKNMGNIKLKHSTKTP